VANSIDPQLVVDHDQAKSVGFPYPPHFMGVVERAQCSGHQEKACFAFEISSKYQI
jgi:hypothetical protein